MGTIPDKFRRWGAIVGCILLVLLCAKVEINGATWSFSTPGLVGAVAVLAFVIVVLLYRLARITERLLIDAGFLRTRLRTRCDGIALAMIVAVMIHFRWSGETITTSRGRTVPEWLIVWSDIDWVLPFILLLVVMIAFYRLVRVLRDVELELARRKRPDDDSSSQD